MFIMEHTMVHVMMWLGFAKTSILPGTAYPIPGLGIHICIYNDCSW